MKNTAVPTAHDALFKQFLTHKETARDFLTLHLPAPLSQLCDLSTLKLESGSFVDEALRATHSDVLYSVTTEQGEGYIYVLIEHQSSPDKLMAFRLMRYAVAAMQRHLDAGNTLLPLVIPMLFYHGRISPYPFSLCWLDMFAQPQRAHELYTTSFPLVDITIVPDEQIMTHRRVALLELLQKHIRLRDLSLLLGKLVTALSLGYTTSQQLRAAMHYLLSNGNTPAPVAFLRRLAHHSPQHKDTLMTIAEQLEELGRRKGFRQGRKEGRNEGRQEGRQQGREEGQKEGQKAEALRIAHEMLRSGIDRPAVLRLTGLSEAELAQLTH